MLKTYDSSQQATMLTPCYSFLLSLSLTHFQSGGKEGEVANRGGREEEERP